MDLMLAAAGGLASDSDAADAIDAAVEGRLAHHHLRKCRLGHADHLHQAHHLNQFVLASD